MIRSANHSSYPRIGSQPYDQEIRRVERLDSRGRLDAAVVREAVDRTASLVVADQARAFVDVVTDGLVGWDGLVARWARHLVGVKPGRVVRWFDTPQFDRVPIVTGDIEWPGAMLRDEFRMAQDVAGERIVKVVLPGPVLFARMAGELEGCDRDRIIRQLTVATAREVAELVTAGCLFVQLDEPLLARYPEDVDRVAEAASAIFESTGQGVATQVSVYHGDPTRFADRIHVLPGTHVGIDVCEGGASALRAIARLPTERGVSLGLFDAGSAVVEDAAEIRKMIEPFRGELEGRDLLVGPQAGLEPLPRDLAFDKLLQARYLAESIREAWS